MDSIDNTTEEVQSVDQELQNGEVLSQGEVDANENNENEEYVVGQDGFVSSDNSTQSSTSTGSGIYHGSTPPKKQKTCKNTNLSTEVVMKEASHALETISSTMKHNFNRNNTITPNEAFANFVMTKLSHITDENVRLDMEQKITMKLYEGIKKCRKYKKKQICYQSTPV
jgi:hypothetical protein